MVGGVLGLAYIAIVGAVFLLSNGSGSALRPAEGAGAGHSSPPALPPVSIRPAVAKTCEQRLEHCQLAHTTAHKDSCCEFLQ